MNWMIKNMYGAWVAISPTNFTIWAKTKRELDALFKNAGYEATEALSD